MSPAHAVMPRDCTAVFAAGAARLRARNAHLPIRRPSLQLGTPRMRKNSASSTVWLSQLQPDHTTFRLNHSTFGPKRPAFRIELTTLRPRHATDEKIDASLRAFLVAPGSQSGTFHAAAGNAAALPIFIACFAVGKRDPADWRAPLCLSRIPKGQGCAWSAHRR